MRNGLDPNDFVDPDDVFEEEYDADEITLASFTIVPGEGVNHAELVYQANGISFLGGSTGSNWAIDLYYGYRYNGQNLPIPDDAARHVLEKLSGTNNFEDYDWAAQDWAYFE